MVTTATAAVSGRNRKKIVHSHPYAPLLEEQEIFCPHAENHALLVYIRSLLEGLAAAFGRQKDRKDDVYNQLYHEALYRAHQVVSRFIRLTEDRTLDVQPSTLRRLLRTVLGTTTIPLPRRTGRRLTSHGRIGDA